MHGSGPLQGELCSNTWTSNQIRISDVGGLDGEEVRTIEHWWNVHSKPSAHRVLPNTNKSTRIGQSGYASLLINIISERSKRGAGVAAHDVHLYHLCLSIALPDATDQTEG